MASVLEERPVAIAQAAVPGLQLGEIERKILEDEYDGYAVHHEAITAFSLDARQQQIDIDSPELLAQRLDHGIR